MWGYLYYDGNVRIGGARCVVSPSSTVRISGGDVDWYSQYNIDRMILPGVSRRVMDSGTGEEMYRIVFWRPGLYEVAAATGSGEWTMTAEERDGQIFFCRRGMPVAAITERIDSAEWIPASGTPLEPRFRTRFYELEDNDGFLMMVLTFPALKMV